jgi:minichromosome maintenance protein 10
MTTAGLNRLLQDPSPVVDVATVTGRTNLLTIGIVFTNSGTKISKTGRAFSILEIGNLVTGPIVTVFLFGDAYSKCSNICIGGTVVALLNPSIVPPSQNSTSKDNALSLSVGDQRQLLPVASAKDYGICKGSSKAKRSDGRLGDFPCKHYVDTRNGFFCAKHCQQGKVVDGKTARDQSFLQKMRQEVPKTTTVADLMNPIRNGTHEFRNPAWMQVPAKNPFLAKAPKNMVKGQSLQTKIETPPRTNPYKTVKPGKPSLPIVASRATEQKRQPITGNWLKDRKTELPSGKKRALNVYGTAEFNGGVMVPKAHPMFRVMGPTQVQSQRQSVTETAQDRARALLERQKSLSTALKDKTNRVPSLAERLKANKPKIAASTANSFFSDLDIDENAVLNTKSRFETEAHAEEYARSRKVVSDLEKTEERELKRVAKKTQNIKGMAKVRREWLCVQCKRTSGVEPTMCKRLGHVVKFKRHIEETKTLTELRLQLQDKSVDDGGITLGAGVEWTNFARG